MKTSLHLPSPTLPTIVAMGAALALVSTACGSSGPSPETGGTVPSVTAIGTEVPPTDSTDAAFISATVGEPVTGYENPVDLAIRSLADSTTQNLIVEQGGLIREMSADGRPGRTVADLTALTRASGEQGLLGLAFDNAGTRAFVNYTDLDGNTTVDQFDVADDGTFLSESRQTIYSVAQPYRNHNGGDLLVMPDGQSLLIFNGDGGSANDPERYALDSSSDLGKIIQVDISSTEPSPRLWASGLRNPWRAAYDSVTGNLWVADVGQNMWEEINVVTLDVVANEQTRGVSFGWSAFEGTIPFNDDQFERHENQFTIDPVFAYPHENNDCSISGGFVYRGTDVPHVGSWYLFTDFCSGNVRALCIEEVAGAMETCGVVSLGIVPNPVGILPDSFGRPWVLSLSGSIVPIIPTN